MRFLLLMGIIIFGSFGACKNDTTQKQNQTSNTMPNVAQYSDLAKEYCACSAALVELNKKAKYLAAHPEAMKSMDEMSELLTQSEILREEQIQCQNKLEVQFDTKIAENATVLEAIKAQCPDLALLMENAKKQED
jgi:predicted RND superfamily exporter protein